MSAAASRRPGGIRAPFSLPLIKHRVFVGKQEYSESLWEEIGGIVASQCDCVEYIYLSYYPARFGRRAYKIY